MLRGDGIRLSSSFFFLTSINATVSVIVPLVPESETIGMCRAFWANSPLLVAG